MLQHHAKEFESLILEIVRAGMLYRKRQGQPITDKQIDQLNGYLLEFGFKFPSLCSQDFRESLRQPDAERATRYAEQIIAEQHIKAKQTDMRAQALAALRERFFSLCQEGDRQAAGLALETVLTDPFELFEIPARSRFRVTGEEIDGSFELDQESYLPEAKWHRRKLAEQQFLVFRGRSRATGFHSWDVYRHQRGVRRSTLRHLGGRSRSFHCRWLR